VGFDRQAARRADLETAGEARDRVRAYASGLDFHLSDDEVTGLFGRADTDGFSALKIKVGRGEFYLPDRNAAEDSHPFIAAN
jgi:L-alanine-DL-glutamate epimerase-like enolase superfamily enzyme